MTFHSIDIPASRAIQALMGLLLLCVAKKWLWVKMWWYLCQMCKNFGKNRSRNALIQYKDRAFQFLSMDRNYLNLNTRGSHVRPHDHCIIVYNAICHGETVLVLFSSSSLFWKARKWKSREIGAHVTQSVHTSQVNNSLEDSVMYMIRFRIFDVFGIYWHNICENQYGTLNL